MQAERSDRPTRERKNPIRSDTERMLDAVRKQTLARRLERKKH